MLLMGDCSCVVGSDPYKTLEKTFVNAKTEAPKLVNEDLNSIHGLGTAPGYGTIIDHVMVTPKGFDITQYQTFANLNVINMSDHVPVGIDFKR
jgi:endonuclease/exonuclease/phosphatase family metal-dependent hydrolase